MPARPATTVSDLLDRARSRRSVAPAVTGGASFGMSEFHPSGLTLGLLAQVQGVTDLVDFTRW